MSVLSASRPSRFAWPGATLATQALAQAAAPALVTGAAAGARDEKRGAARHRAGRPAAARSDTLATIRKTGCLARRRCRLRADCNARSPTASSPASSIDAARRLAEDMGVDVEFVEPRGLGSSEPAESRSDLINQACGGHGAAGAALSISSTTARRRVEGIHVIAESRGRRPARDAGRPRRAERRSFVYAGTLQERLQRASLPKAILLKVTGTRNDLGAGARRRSRCGSGAELRAPR